jgi:hypothetical protein
MIKLILNAILFVLGAIVFIVSKLSERKSYVINV